MGLLWATPLHLPDQLVEDHTRPRLGMGPGRSCDLDRPFLQDPWSGAPASHHEIISHLRPPVLSFL